MRPIQVLVVSLATCVSAAGCGGSQSPAQATADEPAAEPDARAQRPELTADQCEAAGGTVVGDIGDGAIHRPDYRCPSGAEPSGTIRPAEGGPVAVEGSVCCPK